MRVTCEGVDNYMSHNEGFVTAVEGIVHQIFQTEKLGPNGYISVRRQREESVTDAKVGLSVRFSVDDLGAYEMSIFASLAKGVNTVYVLLGEMGSGKTASAHKVLETLRKPRLRRCDTCEVQKRTGDCEPLVFTFNFASAYEALSSSAVHQKFQLDLYDQLRADLRRLMQRSDWVSTFLSHARGNQERITYSAFDALFQYIEDHPAEWLDLAPNQRANRIFAFVEEKSDNLNIRLELLLKLLRFIRAEYRPDQACISMLLDNLDSIRKDAQFSLLSYILSMKSIAGVRLLVPLRPSTFERLPNRAGSSYAVLEHQGPDPRTVLFDRVQHAVEHFSSLPGVAELSTLHREALLKRLNYVKGVLQEQPPVLERMLALAGGSIRHALFLFERAILGSAVRYDVEPRYADELLRLVLHGKTKLKHMGQGDKLVANIFVNPSDGTFSLVLLRILQLVYVLSEPIERRARYLLYLLQNVGEYSDEEVCEAINYLLRVRRPLLWVDGKDEYDSYEHLVDSNDVLHLTEAGKRYFRVLSRDLEYCQEAFVALDWPTDGPGEALPISVNYQHLSARFSLLRKCLRVVAWKDVEEISLLADRKRNGFEFPYQLDLVSSRMIYGLGMSVYRISAVAEHPELVDELLEWSSLVLEACNSEAFVLERDNKYLSGLLENLDSLAESRRLGRGT